MSYSKEDLSKYRMERAKESLEEAKLLGDENHWNTAANRLYYACFYSASSYLVINNYQASTHSGIKNAFNKKLIKPSLIAPRYGLLYNKLFNLRQDADYRDYRDVTEQEIRPMINQVGDLIERIEGLNSGEEE
ncbi:MAG: HEPN domain-containing protein [Bacteroidetes bacterium]|jgi:uncharacterized protein (UPF0332 family)|nr:HEPN domain-containing protein [Bacteroidota bacterium]